MAKDDRMAAYLKVVQQLMANFDTFVIQQVPRDQNAEADALANLGSALDPSHFLTIPIIHVMAPTINETSDEPDTMKHDKVLAVPGEQGSDESWIKHFMEWMEQGILPEDKAAAKRLKVQALSFEINGPYLFKRSVSGLKLRCLDPVEA